jgi:hypothetical protein
MPYNTYDADTSASQSGTVNTSLDGLNVAEGCPAGNMNAAVRILMSAIRQLYNVVNNPLSSVYAAFMPKTGGAFTGDITRNGGGGYAYNASATFVGGKITIQALGGAAPSSPQEGDQWIEY